MSVPVVFAYAGLAIPPPELLDEPPPPEAPPAARRRSHTNPPTTAPVPTAAQASFFLSCNPSDSFTALSSVSEAQRAQLPVGQPAHRLVGLVDAGVGQTGLAGHAGADTQPGAHRVGHRCGDLLVALPRQGPPGEAPHPVPGVAGEAARGTARVVHPGGHRGERVRRDRQRRRQRLGPPVRPVEAGDVDLAVAAYRAAAGHQPRPCSTLTLLP